ncbi:MAG: hypothetical protein BGO27_06560 [Alphaproteobacteria bacterium 33-17]|nr:MAG: hypothetical protein BGO27_06560 [Alphaproteobacteria bacterium 33-17]
MDGSYSILKRLISTYVFKYKALIIFSTIAMIFVAIGNGMNAYLIQPMLDKIFINKDMSMLYSITFIVFGLAVMKGFASFFQNYLMKKLGQKIITEMQIDLYDHLINSDLAYINSFSSGKLISRFTIDINTMRNSVSTVLTGIARDFLSLVFLVGVMIYQNWLLSVLALIVFPVTIHPIIRLGKRMRKLATRTQEELGNYTAQLDETFKNIRIIKSYNREDYEISRASKIINGILGLYLKAARTESVSSPIMESFGGIAVALVVWYGGSQVMEGVTTAGSFFSFIAALIIAYKPLKTLSDLNTNLQEGLAAAKRYFALIDNKPEIREESDASDLKVSNGEIVFKDITFKYGENNILKDFTLIIPPAKTIAIVGESGSGKSTLINLLLRLYDPNSGSIFIDNQDIKESYLRSVRDNIAIVTQEVAIFDDTVENNIAYGNLRASVDEITQAAENALVTDFCSLDAQIGQGGNKLSGGQRQRIAIARALLKNAAIMILDEATSSLDNIVEAKIMENIKRIRRGKTNLIIAHRLSTIIDADLIYVMQHGKIVESGTHEDLMKKEGYYYKLYLRGEE